MFNLKGKKALITGSTQGIGKAIAKEFIKSGAQVIIHCSADIKKSKSVAKELGAYDHCIYNLNDNNPEELFSQTGDVDILVLNASVQYRTAWNKIDCDEFDAQVNINLKSSLQLIQKYSAYMKNNKWGRILTIGSVQQYKPHKDMAVYAATKCAVMSLVKNIAKQLAPQGVTVNNLSPGVIATPRNDTVLSDKNYSEIVMTQIPMNYVGKAEDCSSGALFLCSEEARYITGIDLIIDGGMSL